MKNSTLILIFFIIYSGILTILLIYIASKIREFNNKYEVEIDKMRLQYIKEHEKLIELKKKS